MQIFNFQRLRTTCLFLVRSLCFAFLLFQGGNTTHHCLKLRSEAADRRGLFDGAIGSAAARGRLGRSEELFGLLVIAAVLEQQMAVMVMVVMVAQVTREGASGVSRRAVLAEALGAALARRVQDAQLRGQIRDAVPDLAAENLTFVHHSRLHEVLLLLHVPVIYICPQKTAKKVVICKTDLLKQLSSHE